MIPARSYGLFQIIKEGLTALILQTQSEPGASGSFIETYLILYA